MNRLEWILGIILVVLLLAVAALSLLFWFGPNKTQQVEGPSANSATTIAQRADDIEPTPEFDGRTAKRAYAAAANEATLWQGDAQLLNATATFSQGATPEQLIDGETAWSFTFYSPASSQIALISVVEDNANLLSSNAYTAQNELLSVSGWNIDSSDAVQRVLQEGGRDFIASGANPTLTMALYAEDQEGNGRIQWEASLISLLNGNALILSIDATSGEILNVQTVP